jgi:alanine-glyoxylate transaminase/serine-glyoxylate transaminase/serine-pyruvate transaminase
VGGGIGNNSTDAHSVRYGITDLETASGLGDLSGEIWRIGCMGHSARPKNVTYVMAALGDALTAQTADIDAGLAAASEHLGE